jgi:hypothetical protein
MRRRSSNLLGVFKKKNISKKRKTIYVSTSFFGIDFIDSIFDLRRRRHLFTSTALLRSKLIPHFSTGH